ncbi:MAG: extracellular solute-binding protein [Phycisphaerales bacterium]|jgi:iron(III) transport system substrate-binding protein|nr:extracellular solute-binding protein [Phycisphaerales bacterium]
MRRLISAAVWAVVGACAVACMGCDRSEPTVVVYVSADDYVAKPILEAFEDRSGIRVLMVGDTEARKSTGLIERLRREGAAPVADVLWSSELLGVVSLSRDGLLAPHVSADCQDWPPLWRDPEYRWYAFSPRPRVLVYDPERLHPSECPAEWADLADPRWRGEIVAADPRYGTTGTHLAALRWVLGDAWPAWLDALARNEVRVLPGGNAACVDAVYRGEALLGMTDADDVRAANRNGAALAMTLPGHGSGRGPMLTPNTVAILQGAPHPAEAAALVDWLLSPDVARRLAASVSGNVPLHASVAMEFPDLAVGSPLPLDAAQIHAHHGPAVAQAVDAWGGGANAGGP